MIIGYYKLPPEKIFQDILQSDDHRKVQIKEMDFLVHPHVFPSEKFRTTNFLLDNIQPLVVNARVCDMGCGFGVVGLFALHHGAKNIVQADINPIAVKNAKRNKELNGYSKEVKIYISDCFDRLPKQIFDLIIFNIPFHNEPYEIQNPLQHAFHDPNFRSLKKFLTQSMNYINSNSKIIIAFSNKGNVNDLEGIFDYFGFNWKLWRLTNTNQEFDNRLYQLRFKF